MINKVIHYTKSDNCDIVFESDKQRDDTISMALDSFVRRAGRPDANYYATLQINIQNSQERIAGILAKPRSYKPAANREHEKVGWALAV